MVDRCDQSKSTIYSAHDRLKANIRRLRYLRLASSPDSFTQQLPHLKQKHDHWTIKFYNYHNQQCQFTSAVLMNQVCQQRLLRTQNDKTIQLLWRVFLVRWSHELQTAVQLSVVHVGVLAWHSRPSTSCKGRPRQTIAVFG